MPGTIFGLPLSQQTDVNGAPIVGGKLYLYEAHTTTPVDSFEDYDLTTLNPWPLETDASGRIPQFWLEDGVYRARFTDFPGAPVFDILSVTAIGPSSGEGGGGGGGEGISQSAIFQTGHMDWQPVSGTRSGWVRANGRTIGSASSGAAERANADTQALYEFLWASYSNDLCPVTGGRGGSGAADFAANKPIATLDMRGRAPFGLDDMGNSAAEVISGGTTPGAGTGAAAVTVAQANLPNVNLNHSLTAAEHLHGSGTLAVAGQEDGVVIVGGEELGIQSILPASYEIKQLTVSGDTANAGPLEVSGTVSLGGSGTALGVLNPHRLGTWYFKL